MPSPIHGGASGHDTDRPGKPTEASTSSGGEASYVAFDGLRGVLAVRAHLLLHQMQIHLHDRMLVNKHWCIYFPSYSH